MILHEAPAPQALARIEAVRIAAGTLGAGLSLAFACPAVAAAGIGALSIGARGTRRSALAGPLVFAACVAALALAFFVPHEPPRWVMLGFGVLGVLACLALALAGLPFRPDVARGASAGFAALAGWGVVMALRPAGWVCVAAMLSIAALLVHERWFGARAWR